MRSHVSRAAAQTFENYFLWTPRDEKIMFPLNSKIARAEIEIPLSVPIIS